MSHDNLTTLGASLRAEYQVWLDQSLIAWPDQFGQVGKDWDIFRRLNAELAEMLRPVQEWIEMDAWLNAGFFGIQESGIRDQELGESKEPMPMTGWDHLPTALIPSKSGTLPESTSAPQHGAKTETDSFPMAAPAPTQNPVRTAGSRLRDLARMAQQSVVSDPLPVDSEEDDITNLKHIDASAQVASTRAKHADAHVKDTFTNAADGKANVEDAFINAARVNADAENIFTNAKHTSVEPVNPVAAQSLTPASLLQLRQQLTLEAGENNIVAPESTASQNVPAASVNPLTATPMSIDFERVLMALPFGRLAQSDVSFNTQGQATARNRQALPGSPDAPAANPTAESTLIVEQRVQGAQNSPTAALNQIDIHDLMDTLSQEIWREYQRYYGR